MIELESGFFLYVHEVKKQEDIFGSKILSWTLEICIFCFIFFILCTIDSTSPQFAFVKWKCFMAVL